jgi:ABC-type transport system substrate-binding protein
MLDPGTPSIVAKQYREVLTGCETQGNQVAILRFSQVFHNPRERLAFAVLPASEFQTTAISPDMEFSARPIGTGAMKGSKGTRGVVFDAFPNSHHTPQIAQMQLQEGGDPLVQVRTLINNGVQGIIAVPPPLRPDLRASDEVAMKSYDLRSWWFIAVNTTKAPLNDKRVRQGLNNLIDRNELRKLAIGWSPEQKNSPCELISGPFVQSSPYYNRTVPVLETANAAKAEGLLAPDLLDQIGNQLGAAGFDRQVHNISSDEWNRVVKTGNAKDYDLLIGKWSFGLVEDVSAPRARGASTSSTTRTRRSTSCSSTTRRPTRTRTRRTPTTRSTLRSPRTFPTSSSGSSTRRARGGPR